MLTDALGSTIALVDNTGAVQTGYTYDPFGGVTPSGALSTNELGYTGRENDGTRLYFYRARYYHPALQRFLNEDVTTGEPNLYVYVGNNPTGYSDPFGLERIARGLGYLQLVRDAASATMALLTPSPAYAGGPSPWCMPKINGGEVASVPIGCPPVGAGGGSGGGGGRAPQVPSSPLTRGVMVLSDGSQIQLASGVQGPASTMPKGSPGFDIVTRTHVEGHAAALMRQVGVREATVYINNSAICSSCARLLPRMLPEGSTLTVVTQSGQRFTFTGNPR